MHIFLFDNTNYNKEKEHEYKNSWYPTAEHPACWILHIKKKQAVMRLCTEKNILITKGHQIFQMLLGKQYYCSIQCCFCSVLKTSLP